MAASPSPSQHTASALNRRSNMGAEAVDMVDLAAAVAAERVSMVQERSTDLVMAESRSGSSRRSRNMDPGTAVGGRIGRKKAGKGMVMGTSIRVEEGSMDLEGIPATRGPRMEVEVRRRVEGTRGPLLAGMRRTRGPLLAGMMRRRLGGTRGPLMAGMMRRKQGGTRGPLMAGMMRLKLGGTRGPLMAGMIQAKGKDMAAVLMAITQMMRKRNSAIISTTSVGMVAMMNESQAALPDAPPLY